MNRFLCAHGFKAIKAVIGMSVLVVLTANGQAYKGVITAAPMLGHRIAGNAVLPLHLRPPPATCSLTGPPDACHGVLDASDIETNKGWQALVPEIPHFKKGHDRDRRTSLPATPSESCQNGYALTTTYHNRDLRKMDFNTLSIGKAIVVGYMAYPENCAPDWLYNVGKDLGPDIDTRRFYFIVFHDNNAPAPLKLAWQLYRVDNSGGKYLLAHVNDKPHYITDCEHPGGNDEPASDFWSCKARLQAQMIATDLRITVNQVEALLTCGIGGKPGLCKIPDKLLTSGLDRPSAVRKQQTRAKLVDALDELVRILDFSIDPYWFTCGVGCCTATPT